MSCKRYEKLRKAALAKDFARTDQERIKAAKEFKRLKAKAKGEK